MTVSEVGRMAIFRSSGVDPLYKQLLVFNMNLFCSQKGHTRV